MLFLREAKWLSNCNLKMTKTDDLAAGWWEGVCSQGRSICDMEEDVDGNMTKQHAAVSRPFYSVSCLKPWHWNQSFLRKTAPAKTTSYKVVSIAWQFHVVIYYV